MLERKGPDVKLKLGRSSQEGNGGRQRKFVNKWVHLDRCKEYHSSSMIPTQIELQIDNRRSNDDTPAQMQEYVDAELNLTTPSEEVGI